MKKVLVIAPHPDDEMIGCGGFILKKIREGAAVFVIFFGYVGGEERKKEAMKVKIEAGISKVSFLNIKEPFVFDNKNLQSLIEEIKKINPDVILIPHKDEGDRDHRVCFEISREAIWLSKISDSSEGCKNNPLILLYEIHTPLIDINYYEDISDLIKEKVRLINLYKSQIKFVDYASAIQGLNSYRGKMTGNCKYAEAFKIKKWPSGFRLV